jgi:Putative lumazine-binding
MSLILEIEKLLGEYFDALYTSDAELLSEVMHPKAIYASADEQPLLYRTMDEYLPIVAAREPPASRNEARQDAIVSISLAGDRTAVATVGCAIGSRRFVDFLSLVYVENRWQIIAKVFQIIE